VYKHTSDGWSKWNDGSWNSVTPPDRNSQQNLSGETRQQNLSGETERGGNFRERFGGGSQQGRGQGGFEQLENDRFARTAGAQRQERFGAMAGHMGGGRFRR
jgi:hypothetical protein